MRVLVVEDARDLAQAIAEGLERQGFVVDQCADGEEALRLSERQEYSAILLDCMLPLRDGIEVCRELRSRGSDVPILMLTARDTVEDRVAGLDVGADDYLVKPFAFPELVEQAWNMQSVPSPQVVRAHIKNLRRKLTAPGERGIIETIHGVGYRVIA